MTADIAAEIASGNRFAFGDNWSRFLTSLDDKRIILAERSLCDMLKVNTLVGKRFLDAGSGSGLFSLVARRLGASVHSFDYDPKSVACTEALKRRYFTNDPDWKIERGSVLDGAYVRKLGEFDVVYSWGVLHHTGNMHAALEIIGNAVAPSGQLFISIYNDQRFVSSYWRWVKRAFNAGSAGRIAVTAAHAPYLYGVRSMVRAATGRRPLERGMSLWYDMIDWLGGYPFEVAKPEEIFRCFRDKGFVLQEMTTCGGRMGCNEFVMHRKV